MVTMVGMSCEMYCNTYRTLNSIRGQRCISTESELHLCDIPDALHFTVPYVRMIQANKILLK